MGCEGGINWIKCTDKKKVQSLIEFLRLGWEKDNRYDEYNYKAWDEAEFLNESYIVSTWNSSNYFSSGMESLKEFIEYLQEQREDKNKDFYWQEINPLKLTWIELVQDYLSRPFIEPEGYKNYGWYYDYSIPRLVKYLHYEYGMYFDKISGDFERPSYFDDDIWKILNSTVGSWLDEIEQLVDLKSVGSEETWT